MAWVNQMLSMVDSSYNGYDSLIESMALDFLEMILRDSE